VYNASFPGWLLQSGIQVNNPDGGTSSVVYEQMLIQTTSTTTTGAQVITTNTTNATQTVDTYSVELKARLQGGSSLFDQTYNVAVTDPSFAARITQAKSVLTNAGAGSFTGPTQLSSVQSLVSSVVNTVQTGSTSQSITGSADFIGPAVVPSGNNHATLNGCASPPMLIGVFAGSSNIDTTVLTLATNAQTPTTTNTNLTTQVNELDGSAAATPSIPSSIILAFVGLAGLGTYTARSRRAWISK
jgi:hypothetical protein